LDIDCRAWGGRWRASKQFEWDVQPGNGLAKGASRAAEFVRNRAPGSDRVQQVAAIIAQFCLAR
jgi:hypothetical protein